MRNIGGGELNGLESIGQGKYKTRRRLRILCATYDARRRVLAPFDDVATAQHVHDCGERGRSSDEDASGCEQSKVQ